MGRLISILNTVAASAADISTSGGYLTINESGSPITPALRYSYITKGMNKAILPSKQNVRTAKKVSFTAANDTDYKFVVTQTVGGVVTTKTARYTSDASGTNAEIGQGLADSFNNAVESTFGQAVQATAYYTASNAFLHVLSDATYGPIGVTAVENVTVATDQAATFAASTSMASSIGSNLYLPNVITSIAGTTTVTVTSTAHGLPSGAWVAITGITADAGTYTITSDLSNTDLPTATFRITSTGANTFTLDNATGAFGGGGATVTAATVTYVDQLSRGMLADVQTDVASVNSATVTGTASAASYAAINFNYAAEVPATNNLLDTSVSGNLLTLYVSEADSDVEAFLIGLSNVLNGAIVNSGTASTTANAELIAVA